MCKKILIISNFYPPLQHIAVNRIYSFAKYLTEFGYDVTVLTKNFKGENIGENIQRLKVVKVNELKWFQLADTNKKECKMFHYVKALYNFLLINLLVDDVSNWTKNALTEGRKLFKENSYDYIISSAPPIGPHIVAEMLKKENNGVKWIADMRDALSRAKSYPLIKRKRLQFYEKSFLLNCDALMCVSEPQLKDYSTNIKKDTKILEVRNGFDFDLEYPKTILKRNEYFTIVFAGTFYKDINPNNFLKGLGKAIEKNNLKIKVRFIGPSKPISIQKSLKKYVNIEDRKSYNDIIFILKNEADCLLLIIPKTREKGIYSGKLFDYIGACTPILGLVPKNDVAANLITNLNAGYIAENENIEEIKNAILKAYNRWKNKEKFNINVDEVKKYHRKEQVKLLSKMIKEQLEDS